MNKFKKVQFFYNGEELDNICHLYEHEIQSKLDQFQAMTTKAVITYRILN